MLFSTRNKATLPERRERAAGSRPRPCRCPPSTTVLGTPLTPPFPEGIEVAYFGLGCFWGAERAFWSLPGVYTTAVGYQGGITPNPTYDEVCSGRHRPHRGGPGRLRPHQDLLRRAPKTFWEVHDPTQGMRQGNDVGTQYRSAIYTVGDEQAKAAELVAPPLRATRSRGGQGRDHDRDRPGRARSTTPRTTTSSTSRQEPRRLLRRWRHGRQLPDRRRRAGPGPDAPSTRRVTKRRATRRSSRGPSCAPRPISTSPPRIAAMRGAC